MVYRDFKNLSRRTVSDEILCDKAFNQSEIWYQRGLSSMVYKFLDKNSSGRDINNEIKPNQELVEILRKLNIRKLEQRKVHSSFIDNIWGVVLADMQFISKFNKEFFLFCVIDIYGKYTLLFLKDKKVIKLQILFKMI